MFMIAMFLLMCIAGGIWQGSVDYAATRLTVAINATATTPITVNSTEGFADSGIIVIGDEHIAYSDTTATTFSGSAFKPLLRGAENTEAVAHVIGDIARTKSGAMMNTAADYNIAVIADAGGAQAFVAKPVAFFQLLGSFLFLPIEFLGTDLQILGVLWSVFGIGMIIVLVITLAGGRRV